MKNSPINLSFTVRAKLHVLRLNQTAGEIKTYHQYPTSAESLNDLKLAYNGKNSRHKTRAIMASNIYGGNHYLMTKETLKVNETVEEVERLLKQTDDLPPALEASIKMLLTVVKLLADRAGLNSSSSSNSSTNSRRFRRTSVQ